MPTDSSVAANRIARAIFIVGLGLAILVILLTLLQQRFIIQLIGDETPDAIRFVRTDGVIVLCEKRNETPEYVCRRE